MVNAQEFEQATAELREVGSPHAQRFPLTVAVLHSSIRVEFASACRALFDGLDALLALCGQDLRRLGALCGLREQEMSLLDVCPTQRWGLIARPDIVLAGDRALIVEANCESPAVLFTLHDMLMRGQRTVTTTSRSLDQLEAWCAPVTPALIDGVRAEMVTADGAVPVCHWKREEALGPNWSYLSLSRELTLNGIPSKVAALEDLTLTPDGACSGDDRLAAVYRFFESPEPDARDEWATLERVLGQVAGGRLGLFTGYRGELIASKICLAMLSDDRYTEQMPGELARRLRRHIPWTRLVVEGPARREDKPVDLYPWIIANRTSLVLKPGRGYQGREVVIGAETPPPAWRVALDRALGEGRAGRLWIVQELVASEPESFVAARASESTWSGLSPVVYGAFVVNRELLGVLRRYGIAADQRLNINPVSGYVPAPVWWTDRSEALDRR